MTNINIQLPLGQIMPLSIALSQRVSDLKKELYKALLVEPSKQVLIFNGVILLDCEELTSYCLIENSIIILHVRESRPVSNESFTMFIQTILKSDPRFLYMWGETQMFGEISPRRPSCDEARLKDRIRDLRFNAIESRPRGMMTLMKFHRTLETFIDSTIGLISQRMGANQTTIIPKKTKGPSEAPLPIYEEKNRLGLENIGLPIPNPAGGQEDDSSRASDQPYPEQ